MYPAKDGEWIAMSAETEVVWQILAAQMRGKATSSNFSQRVERTAKFEKNTERCPPL